MKQPTITEALTAMEEYNAGYAAGGEPDFPQWAFNMVREKTFPPIGFFPLPKEVTCHCPEHNAPTHLFIPPGQGYTHMCPNCGARQTLSGSSVSYMAANIPFILQKQAY